MAGTISVDVAPLDLLQQTLPQLLSNLSIARAQIAIDQIRATIDTRSLENLTFLGASPRDATPSHPEAPDQQSSHGTEFSAAAIVIQQPPSAELDKTSSNACSASSDMATMIHAGFLEGIESGNSKGLPDSIRQELISAVAVELDRRLRSQGVDFVQWATDPKPMLDNSLERWCLGLGFEAIGCLDYLSCELQSDRSYAHGRESEATETNDHSETDHPALCFEPVCWDSPTAMDLFADLVERTYQATLDCPDLSRFRTPRQTLQGYRSSSAFDPATWFHVKDHNNRDVGCLVMASHHDTQSPSPDPSNTVSELVYMGLVPEARGQGHGQRLVDYVMQRTREQGRKRVILAVDQTNTPARSIYDQFGFRKMLSETVWAKRLTSAKRETRSVA